MTISTASRTTIVPIDRAYDQPDELLRLVQASGPYWNQSRYIPNGAKLGPGHPLVAPNGLRTAPGWLLLGLARTGLAGRWRLRVATAISWLYRGEGGGLTCWPDGPEGEPATVTELWNRAVVLDADSVHHRVESVGRPGIPAAAVTRQSSIAVVEEDGADRWVVDGADRPTSYALADVRVSVSWKAAVFTSADERDAYLDGRDPLTVEHAAEMLAAEVRRRGGDLPVGVAVDDVRFADAVEMVVPRVTPVADAEATS